MRTRHNDKTRLNNERKKTRQRNNVLESNTQRQETMTGRTRERHRDRTGTDK